MNKHAASHLGGWRKSFSGHEHTDAIVFACNKPHTHKKTLSPLLFFPANCCLWCDLEREKSEKEAGERKNNNWKKLELMRSNLADPRRQANVIAVNFP